MKKHKAAPFRWVPFSLKQKRVLTWWMDGSPHKEKDGIICDGSVRAGKTIVMSFAFVVWAMESFNYQNFILAGKTIGAFRRNVLFLLKIILRMRGYTVQDRRADNLVIITHKKTRAVNYFYIFGGRDERSQDLVQGITAAGAFFDEVALMPESFVNQAIARCSVDGAKLWFNCNPEGPYHWFKLEFLDKLIEKNLLHLHFTMDDNPALTEKTKQRYMRMFSGVFFKRYILGLWVMAEGIIYDMFDETKHKIPTENRTYSEYYIAIDYGTQNPATFGLWGKCSAGKYRGKWIKVKEYYYSGKDESKQKTDEEFYQDLEKFAGGIEIKYVIVDPSAASFIALTKKRNRFKVRNAANEVLDGIRNVATALNNEMILYNDCCINTFREFFSYVWDEKAAERGEDKPVKQNDHCLDGDRYFINTVLFNKNTIEFLK